MLCIADLLAYIVFVHLCHIQWIQSIGYICHLYDLVRDPFWKYKHIYKFATLSCPTCRSDLVAGPFDQEARRRQNREIFGTANLISFLTHGWSI